jgi:hypothetical protein
MLSDGDWVGGGVQRRFDSTNASISIGGTAAYMSIGVAGGTAGDSYTLEFAAPPGKVLLAGGVYVNAQRAPFREAGRPGIDIHGSGRGCNTITGLFEVKDIVVAPNGTVTGAWIVYEQHCEGGSAALWGEVRVGVPTPAAPLLAPGIVRWPATDVGRAATVVPAAVVATDGPRTMATATLTGAGASDFVIRSDECSGRSLAAGAACQVWVRFVPQTAGTRLATLRLTDSTGAAHTVTLQGFAYGGSTRVQMTSDPGDYIGQGHPWSYTTSNSRISFGGSRSFAGFDVDGADGSWWSAEFVPGEGDILAVGSYPNATRYPFNGTGPGLSVTGNGRGCNTLRGSFDVTWVDFGSDGRLRSFGVTFVQHCEGGAPALRGTFEFRAGDTTPLAEWMIGYVPSVPGAPTNVTAGAGDAQAQVTWTAPASDGGSPITGYVITPYIGAAAQPSVEAPAGTSHVVTGLTNGATYTFRVAAKNAVGAGPQSAPSNAVTPRAGTLASADFDGDGDSEVGVWRPSNGVWALRDLPWTPFGVTGDIPVPADYDGDGDAEIAVFHPSSGLWAINGLPWAQFGVSGDVPVPADYDGDGDAEIAIFRPSNGLWAINGLPWAQFGVNEDMPVPADYDGDGDAEIAVFRPSNGLWAISGLPWAQFGISGDLPVPADYDGDGDAEIAIFRPSNGLWAIQGLPWAQFGVAGDIPVTLAPGLRSQAASDPPTPAAAAAT